MKPGDIAYIGDSPWPRNFWIVQGDHDQQRYTLSHVNSFAKSNNLIYKNDVYPGVMTFAGPMPKGVR